MNEEEPQYFKEFRLGINNKFDGIDKRFDIINKRFDCIDQKLETVEKSVNDLAIITYNQYQEVIKRLDGHDERFEQIDARFDQIDERFNRVDSDIYDLKDSVTKIEGHIGRYEIRAQNIEQILLQDFKPRIQALEKEVFA